MLLFSHPSFSLAGRCRHRAQPRAAALRSPSEQGLVPWEGLRLGVAAAVPAVLAGFLLWILEAPITWAPCAPAGCSPLLEDQVWGGRGAAAVIPRSPPSPCLRQGASRPRTRGVCAGKLEHERT